METKHGLVQKSTPVTLSVRIIRLLPKRVETMLTFYGSVGFNKSLSSYKGNDQSNKTVNFSVDAKLRDNLRTKFQFSASQSETNAYYTGVNPEDYALNTSRILAPDEWYTINESKAYFELDNGTAI